MIVKIDIPDAKGAIKKPIIPAIMLAFVIVIGTIGYYLIWLDEGASIIDALFMVAITITTVGYGEVLPLDDTGHLFTIIISFLGIGSLFYMFGVIMENLFIYQTLNIRGRKKMLKKIKQMQDHYVVVGFGRVGTLTAFELKERGEEFVVIDTKININHSYFSEDEVIGLEGDATEDETLEAAGVDRAKGLIVATGNAAVTTFVVISARQMNPNLNIVARADDEPVIKKLEKAGADRVVNPYAAGGYKLASIAVNPSIVDFFDSGLKKNNKGFNLEMIEIPQGCSFINKNLKELDLRKNTGVTVVSIIDLNGEFIIPNGEYVFKGGEKILSAGNINQLQSVEKMLY